MIYLACPMYGGLTQHAHRAILAASQQHTVEHCSNIFSALTFNFNTMWCDMLNKRVDNDIEWFAMVHSDIHVLDNTAWLDILVEIATDEQLDVVSVVLPLKDTRGLTSTALFCKSKNVIVKRLTMHEINMLPTTFTYNDIVMQQDKLGILLNNSNVDDFQLCVNTGLMLVRVNDWCEKVFFRTEDYVLKITEKETGKVTFSPQFKSEDWLFSIDVQKLDVKIAATTAISVEHMGMYGYPNYGEWGSLKRDDLSL